MQVYLTEEYPLGPLVVLYYHFEREKKVNLIVLGLTSENKCIHFVLNYSKYVYLFIELVLREFKVLQY